MELSPNQISQFMKRFPAIELSYETISHKKVSPTYNSCLAIPQGKKCYAWFTFYNDQNVCILFELNREKKISKGHIVTVELPSQLCLGSLLYGTLTQETQDGESEKASNPYFVVEEIFLYAGIPLKKSCFKEKLLFMEKMMADLPKTFTKSNHMVFCLPVIWKIEKTEEYELMTSVPGPALDSIGYTIHHIQYRSLGEIKPYLNVFLNRKMNFSNAVMTSKPESFDGLQSSLQTGLQTALQTGLQTSSTELQTSSTALKTELQTSLKTDLEKFDFICDYAKPQYRYPTIFQVTADIQFDIYHMFAYSVTHTKNVYFDVAYIPNYKSSVFMNGLFRNIKENANLDCIEESDDEEEFQNMAEDRFVDIQKVLFMECLFHTKFKKWVPVRVVDDNTKIVYVEKLIRGENDPSRQNHRPQNPRSQYQNQNPRSQNQQQVSRPNQNPRPNYQNQQQVSRPNYQNQQQVSRPQNQQQVSRPQNQEQVSRPSHRPNYQQVSRPNHRPNYQQNQEQVSRPQNQQQVPRPPYQPRPQQKSL